MVVYGFYSAMADRQEGHCTYISEKGQNVKVTAVSSTPFCYYWPDVIPLSIVTEFVSSEWKWKWSQQGEQYYICQYEQYDYTDYTDSHIKSATCWTPRISREWQNFLKWDTKESPNPFFPVPDFEALTVVLRPPPTYHPPK